MSADSIQTSDPLMEALTRVRSQLASQQMQYAIDLIGAIDNQLNPLDISAQAGTLLGQHEGEIAWHLDRDSRFSTARRHLNGYDHSGLFFPDRCATYLIIESLRTSPEIALGKALKVLALNTGPGLYVRSLWGLAVSGEIKLTDEVSLMPLGQLPMSPQARQLRSGSQSPHFAPDAGMFMNNNPMCALVVRRTVDPLWLDGTTDGSAFAGLGDDSELLDEIATILTVVGPSCPIASAGWWQFEDPDLQAAQMIHGRHLQYHEIVPKPNDPVTWVDSAIAPAMVSGYFKLDQQTRQRVKLCCVRLNRTLRRHDFADRAVELAIALESLTGDGQTNELTHKVKTRCARFLGGSAEERLETASLVAATYSIRSKLVHTGKCEFLKKKIGSELLDGETIVKKSAGICARMLREVILRGAIPDWLALDVGGD